VAVEHCGEKREGAFARTSAARRRSAGRRLGLPGVAAVAHDAPHMQLPLALGAGFRPLRRSFDPDWRFLGPRRHFIRPHDGTLRVNAAPRVSRLATDGTNGTRRADKDRLRMVHGRSRPPKISRWRVASAVATNMSWRRARVSRRKAPVMEFGAWVQKEGGRLECLIALILIPRGEPAMRRHLGQSRLRFSQVKM
jgi:hypothetical protein